MSRARPARDGVAGVMGAALNASATSVASVASDPSGAPLQYTVAVRTLCEFTAKQGDLD